MTPINKTLSKHVDWLRPGASYRRTREEVPDDTTFQTDVLTLLASEDPDHRAFAIELLAEMTPQTQ